MFDYVAWARDLQSSELDLIDLLQIHTELIEENKKLKEVNLKLKLDTCPICDEK